MHKLLNKITENNILIDVVNGKLKLFSHDENIDDKLLQEIKENKEKLISFIEKQQHVYIDNKFSEEKFLIACKEVLGLETLLLEDDFFLLGGHSVDAIKVINFLEANYNLKLNVQIFFDERILKDIARFLTPMQGEITNESVDLLALSEGPASSNQEKFWFLAQVADDSNYNIPIVLEWKGEIDEHIMYSAIEVSINKFQALRTCFKEEIGKIIQVIESKIDFQIDLCDWRFEKRSWEDVEEHFYASICERFNLEKAPLFRSLIYKLQGGSSAFALVVHHSIMDAWSLEILLMDIFKNYDSIDRGKKIPVEPSVFNSIEFAINEQRNKSDVMSFWSETLKDVQKHELPWYKGTNSPEKFDAHLKVWELNEEFKNRLNDIASHTNTTLYTVLLSSYILMLSKLNNSSDSIIGVPFSGREQGNLKDVVGNFVKLLPIRNNISDSITFNQLIRSVYKQLYLIQKNQNISLDEIIQHLDLNGNIFDSGFTWYGKSELKKLSSDFELVKVHHLKQSLSKFPLWIYGYESNGIVSLQIEYRIQNFTDNEIGHLLTCWNNILTQVCLKPELLVKNITLISQDEIKELHTLSQGPKQQSEKNIIEIFEETVAAFPDNTALNFIGEIYSYSRLNKMANQLAHQLIFTHRVKKGNKVILLHDKSPYLFISILAVLKAGGCYVPLQPEIPDEQLNFIVNDVNAVVALTTADRIDIINRLQIPVVFSDLEITGDESEQNPDIKQYANDSAYIMYTSGSTGYPKGVEIFHKSVVRLTNSSTYQKLDSSDINLSFTDYSFDGSIQEIFTTFLNGAQLVCVSKEKLVGLSELSSLVDEYKINNLPWIAAQLFNQIVDFKPELINKFKTIVFGGEAASLKHVRKALQYRRYNNSLVNGYGPTEGAVFSACHIITEVKDSDQNIPIGKPVTGTSIYILDQNLTMLPKGVIGEIYIGGEGLAKGYINNAEETNKKFILNPFDSGSKIYASGDYGAWDENGNLRFYGRKDNQLKVRGYRVELEQVMNALNNCPDVKSSFVSVVKKGDTTELVAYVTGDAANNLSKLRVDLSRHINPYMIPAYFIPMETLPLNKNGKVDKFALPENRVTVNYETPVNETEEIILSIWKEVLKLDNIGVTNSFFELGGQSIKAIIVLALIEEKLGWNITIGEFFSTPTIREISELLKTKTDIFVIQPAPEMEYYPASHAQKRLWLYQELNVSSTIYNVIGIYEISGKIDFQAIKEALIVLIARHENLRTSFHVINGTLCQKIHKDTFIDFTENCNKEKLLKDILTESKDFNSSFQLHETPLFRVRLLESKDKKQVLYFAIHHIICDEWSFDVLFKEFTTLIGSGRRNRLNPILIQYKDYAVWHNGFIKSEESKLQLEFWKTYLKDLPQTAYLEYDRELKQEIKSGQISVNVGAAEKKKFEEIILKRQGTLFMGILGVLSILIHKYINRNDIVIGTPLVGRQQKELTDVVGFFVNVLPVRNYVNGEESFIQFFKGLRTSVIQVLDHQQYPYDLMLDKLAPKDGSFFQTGITWHNIMGNRDVISLEQDDITYYKLDYNLDAIFHDLWLFGSESENQISFTIRYNTEKYRKETIEEFSNNLIKTIDFVIHNHNSPIRELKIFRKNSEKIIHNIDDIEFKF